MHVLALSIPLHLLYIAGTYFLEAIKKPGISTVVMWVANAVNLGLNLLWVPEHGAIGSAWATVGARVFLAGALLLWIFLLRDGATYGVRKVGRARAWLRRAAGCWRRRRREPGRGSGRLLRHDSDCRAHRRRRGRGLPDPAQPDGVRVHDRAWPGGGDGGAGVGSDRPQSAARRRARGLDRHWLNAIGMLSALSAIFVFADADRSRLHG